jgi:tRNA threonylcarbamoyladenosine biosynthesis protein TsaE
MKESWHIYSEHEMVGVARELSHELHPGDVILLHGELGAGKTAFVRALAHALGSERPVRSPTFTLVHVYPTRHATIRFLVHADLYRLPPSSKATDELGLDEWLGRSDAVVAIEWPRDDTPLHGSRAWRVQFRFGDQDEERFIEVGVV